MALEKTPRSMPLVSETSVPNIPLDKHVVLLTNFNQKKLAEIYKDYILCPEILTRQDNIQ